MMKNKSKLIILLIISIIIVIVILCAYIIYLKLSEKSEINGELEDVIIAGEVSNKNDFFIVEECVNKYFENLNDNDAKGVYNLLNNKYKNANGINSSNVLQKVYKLESEFDEFFVKDIYYKEIDYGNKRQYYIYGEILEDNYKIIQTAYVIIDLDFTNMTFDIMFNDDIQVNEQEFLNIIENVKDSNTKELEYIENQDIELNNYNSFEYNICSTEDEIYHYLEYYTTMSVYHSEIAYNLLDEEYKNKRFGSLEDYKDYVSNNEYKLLNSAIKEYNVSEDEEYTQYIILDTNGNYYIFRVTSTMKYTVLTDYYTVEIPEFTNKYDSVSDEEKVALNIKKVILALNSEDYNYVYNKLSQDFRNSKYATLEDFENYFSSIYPANAELSFNTMEKIGDAYVYNITLEGSRANSAGTVDIQIIMELEENRDFIMSFNVKNELGGI